MGNQDESLEKQLKPFNFPFSILNLFVFCGVKSNPMTAFSQFESRLLNETRGLNFIQILMIFLMLWTTIASMSAQVPKRLEAIHLTGIEEVVSNVPVKYQYHSSSFVATRFLECHADTGVTGYILEALPGEEMHFEDMYDKSQNEGNRIPIGLTEVQRTEQLLVDELNR